MSPADTDVLQIVSKSVTHKDEKYEISIPRKKGKQLDSKHCVALNRLANTEKWLLKDIELGKNYNEIVIQYLENRYIKRGDREGTKMVGIYHIFQCYNLINQQLE